MIRNQWYAVLLSHEVPVNKPIGVTRLNEKLVFWRNESGKISCFKDQCSHRGVQLSCGHIEHDRLICPFHGFEFDSTGTCTRIPANGKNSEVSANYAVAGYQSIEKHGFIWIFWGEKNETYPEIPWFDDLDESFHTTFVPDHWNAHYTRVIENQLDCVHVPFIHRKTIGKGNRTLVNGPFCKIENELITMRVNNVLDDGSVPKAPSEMPDDPTMFTLQFRFPNIWQNCIAEKLRVMIAFAPVDNENTIAYIGFCQKFMKAPILRHLIGKLGAYYNLKVAHEDRIVVETQFPKISGLSIGEKLIPGDMPVVLYRKYRDELLRKSES